MTETCDKEECKESAKYFYVEKTSRAYCARCPCHSKVLVDVLVDLMAQSRGVYRDPVYSWEVVPEDEYIAYRVMTE